MRVITGAARGVPLATLPGEDIVRPTSQKMKEALFSAIQFEIAGRRALDAFAGSGQLGIEALSRSAEHCLFLELDGGALQIVKQNLARAKLADKASVMQVDALQYLRRTTELFDLIFLDPPYGKEILQAAIPVAAERLRPDGILVCEAPRAESLPDWHGDVQLRKTYAHGKAKLCIYRRGTAQ
ncbi:MAG: 16S rRNA (guanine(966)-N(2))-methyltransferase RsmD [Oscillospiraceae bacterium]|jgi:16S rRNA (guanine(966)-N(2))-methyltransferase RsmD|nr:16S rRNA (guanine(966)-N(2))-methyltransferase RsmD [Oscillospiraceae bacterium]